MVDIDNKIDYKGFIDKERNNKMMNIYFFENSNTDLGYFYGGYENMVIVAKDKEEAIKLALYIDKDGDISRWEENAWPEMENTKITCLGQTGVFDCPKFLTGKYIPENPNYDE